MDREHTSFTQKLTVAVVGLFGINFVIFIHELGHFLSAKIFGISTPVFSLGFGPQLIGYQVGDTLFQIALLPLGGYVAIDEAALALRSYPVNMTVMSAGIICNVLLAYGIFAYLTACIGCNQNERDMARGRRLRMHERLIQFLRAEGYTQGIVGPIGIIGMLGKSVLVSPRMFLLVMGILSFNIGMFNLIPLPFLDGGQMLRLTLERLFGGLGEGAANLISWFLSGMFLLAILAGSRKRR